MKTFGNTKGGQSNGFEDTPKYWKDCNFFPRSMFKQANQHHLTIIGGIFPMVTYKAETLSGKEFPIACSAFNPETEEYDGVNPLRDWHGTAGTQAYLANVLVHEYLTDPSKNKNANLGPICVFEMTNGIIAGITNVQESWNLAICSDEAMSRVCLTGAASGGGNAGPVKYTMNGVPAQAGYTREYIDQMVANGQAHIWDLRAYAESKMFAPLDMLIFCARNQYYFSMDEFDAYAHKYAAQSGRYKFVMTKAELPDANAYPGWVCWEEGREKVKKVLEQANSTSEAGNTGYSQPGSFNNAGGNPPPPPPAANNAATPPAATPPAASAPAATPPAATPPAATPPAATPPAAATPPTPAAATPPTPSSPPLTTGAPPAAATPPLPGPGAVTPATPPLPGAPAPTPA